MADGAKINNLLELANNGNSTAAAELLELLLESKVLVPVDPRKARLQPDDAIAGSGEKKVNTFITVQVDGREVLPIFTTVEFLYEWAEQEAPLVEQDFKSLLWLTGEELWLHLNPAQEFGKEFSPWEIERLRQGQDAIAEIVAELGFGETEYVEISEDEEFFPALKKQLAVLLEVYPQVEEAFLVSVREPDTLKPVAALGIIQQGLSSEQLIAIGDELHNCFAGRTTEYASIRLIDDLADDNSHNWTLFGNLRPFYIAQKTVPESEGIVSQLKNIFKATAKRNES